MKRLIVRSADVVLSPTILLSSVLLKRIRKSGMSHTPISKKIFNTVGVFPIQDHYYEPMFNPASLTKSLRDDRNLPGVDLNVQVQLSMLERFDYNEELKRLPLNQQATTDFYYHNGLFESGDAEYLYNMIRLHKPSALVEVGSGFSTLIARKAIEKNTEEDAWYTCRHVCIEPYENEWLGELDAEIIREPVQHLDERLFESLGENDVLFIDSSHVIRPQGDVLFEYLEILPVLKPGVLVHVHDIFTPKDYTDNVILDQVRFWNEQYLLEAFLSFNDYFEVVGAVNFLAHNYRSELSSKCPVYGTEAAHREPGSFWLVRTAKDHVHSPGETKEPAPR